jgi:hypothetical protein
MPLDAQQFIRLKQALADAFSTKEILEPLARKARNKSLDQLALGDNLIAIIEKMIRLAEDEVWLSDLVNAAVELRQDHQELQRIQAELQPLLVLEEIDHYEVLLLRGDRALVNRKALRQALRNMNQNAVQGKRILIVDGPPISGKTYSLQFISYLHTAIKSFKLAWIDLGRLALEEGGEIRPEALGRKIASQAGLEGMPARGQEQDARWVGQFCDWITGALADEDQIRYIVIDGFGSTLLPQGTHDLIHQLAIRVEINLSMLRLVLISYRNRDSLPLEVVAGVEYEYISPIDNAELISFFTRLYDDRKRMHQTEYSFNDVTKSVAAVLSQLPPQDSRRLVHLGEAVAKEAKKILNLGG